MEKEATKEQKGRRGIVAHPVDQRLDQYFAKITGMEVTLCSERCKYWRFPHLDRPCVLSEVFSVRRGKPCFKFVDRNERETTGGSG